MGSRFRLGRVRSAGLGLFFPGGCSAGGKDSVLISASLPLGFFTGGWLLSLASLAQLLGERPCMADMATAVADLGGLPCFFSSGGVSLSGGRVPLLTGGNLDGRPRFFDSGGASSIGERVVLLGGDANFSSRPCFFRGMGISSLGGGTNFERSATA
jgi:hypothetical protein